MFHRAYYLIIHQIISHEMWEAKRLSSSQCLANLPAGEDKTSQTLLLLSQEMRRQQENLCHPLMNVAIWDG
jgi:hypothetical protein